MLETNHASALVDDSLIPSAEDSAADAEYTLESAVVCPSCNSSVSVLRVVRMLRTRVNFTSTLPRRGRVITCSDCRAILSVQLGTQL